MGEIVNQILTALKERQTFLLDQPLVTMLGLSGQALPPRGTGLKTGRAGERRAGRPRGFIERLQRHYGY